MFIIALVTPGGTVSADVRAISYIGIPLAILFVHANNITDEAGIAAAAAPIGAAVGTIGTVLFYGTATMNLLWQHIGWKAVEEGNFKKTLCSGLGLPMDFSLPLLLPSNHDYHQIR